MKKFLIVLVVLTLVLGVFASCGDIAPPKPQEPTTYTVVEGDCLWKIAQAQLGNKDLWPLIWEANGNERNPDLIYTGEILSLNVDLSSEAVTWATAYSKWRRTVWPDISS